MAKIVRHVLKADEVALSGSLQLSMDPAATPGCTGSRAAPGGSSVRLAENHPEYAVLEVTCPCGRITYVRCEYAAGPSLVPQGSTNA